jgi:hypothetical protein
MLVLIALQAASAGGVDPLPPVALSWIQRQETERSGHPGRLLGDSGLDITAIGTTIGQRRLWSEKIRIACPVRRASAPMHQ